MASDGRQWMQYPEFIVDMPADGKVTGRLEFAVIRGNHISITTVRTAVNNDEPGITYRGAEYRVHVRAIKVNGEWQAADEYTSVMKRESWNVGAAPTIYRAVVDAIVAHIPTAVTPMTFAAAEWADAYNDESRELETVAELEVKLKTARATLRQATNRAKKAADAKTAATVEMIAEAK